jgi:hypothetical protein
MSKRTQLLNSLLIVFVFVFFSVSLFAQQKADLGKIVGDWNMEGDVDGEYIYFSLVFAEKEGKLSGTISEASGYFMDVELNKFEYDNKILKFDFTTPTPPDDMERTVKVELNVLDGKLEGYMFVDDLGMSIPVTASKVKN